MPLTSLTSLHCQGRLKVPATSPDCQHSQRYLTCANEANEAPQLFIIPALCK